MAATLIVPEIAEVKSYMSETGWQQRPPGVAGSLWAKGESRIGVPHDDSDLDTIAGVVQRLATAEGIAAGSMAERIHYFKVDRAKLRAVNDFRITDSIPLSALATISSASYLMLRSTGTTSLRGPTPDIAGNFSSRGDRVAEEARAGHTENGSYVIPLLMKLSDPGQPLPGMEYIAEPIERRVMSTFARSVAAVKTMIVEPAREPTPDDLDAVVEQGVSRDFCIGLSRVLGEDAVSEFETQFKWAPAVEHPPLPESVAISSDALRLVELAAERLRRTKVDPTQVFIGRIVELRHERGNAYGWVKLSTTRHGRHCEILVRLVADQYTWAVEWHQEEREVVVEGQVRSTVGRPLTIDAPKRFVAAAA
jgi:hypothetical protein